MKRPKAVSGFLSGALFLLSCPVFAEGEPRAAGTSGAEPNVVVLGRPWTVLLSLERALLLGPYIQDGPRGNGGMSVGLGPYLRSTDIKTSAPFLPHAAPRLMADLVLGDQISVGGGAGYGISVAGIDDQNGSPMSDSERATTTAVILGRLGYLYASSSNKKSVLWTRVGASYAFGSSPREDALYAGETIESDIEHVALDIDLGFVFPLARHFALTLNISAMIGLYGTDDRRHTSTGGGSGSDFGDGEVRRVHDAFTLWLGALAFL